MMTLTNFNALKGYKEPFQKYFHFFLRRICIFKKGAYICNPKSNERHLICRKIAR